MTGKQGESAGGPHGTERVRAALFDVDDTLFDSVTMVRMARLNAVKAMIEAGLPLADEREGYRLLMRVIRRYGSNYGKHFDRLLESLGVPWDPRVIAAGIVAYHDTKFACLKVDPDVIPTLITLRDRGYMLGIISNGRLIKQWEKIIRLGLHHYFHVVVVSEEVGSEKPDVRIFETALRRLGVRPFEAVYVGDRLDTDILGANRAGLVSVRILKGRYRRRRPAAEEMKPRYEIRRLSELLEILTGRAPGIETRRPPSSFSRPPSNNR